MVILITTVFVQMLIKIRGDLGERTSAPPGRTSRYLPKLEVLKKIFRTVECSKNKKIVFEIYSDLARKW